MDSCAHKLENSAAVGEPHSGSQFPRAEKELKDVGDVSNRDAWPVVLEGDFLLGAVDCAS